MWIAPNEGVFSLKDDDEQWMSLCYDLTAPLARHVAANLQNPPKPFRRYQTGTVWRNEKPGPGARSANSRQFDAGHGRVRQRYLADAELLMMLLCDTFEALGLGARRLSGQGFNNRKLLDGVLARRHSRLEDRERRGPFWKALSTRWIGWA